MRNRNDIAEGGSKIVAFSKKIMEGNYLMIPGNNKRLDTEDDVDDILKEIESCVDLEVLKLSGNSYGTDAARAIGHVLSKHKTLKRALWSDMFVSRLKDEIPLALDHLGNGLITSGAHLVELDVSDNAFGPTGVKGLKTLLNSSVCYSLKVLKINNTGLGIGGGKILSKCLLECYQEAINNGGKFCLEVFQAGRNRLENDGAIALAEVFEVFGSLIEISLPQNGIYHEGISALAEAFGNNNQLEVLNLSDNTMTEEGSVAMATILPQLQQLRVINFGDCLVRSDGAILVAEALRDGHNRLQELYLGFCELNVDSALEVAIAMEDKRELKRLDLNGNCFGNEGIDLIRDTLEAKGHSEDVLGSFSDDEGDSEEDDNSNHDDNESDNDKDPSLNCNDKQPNESEDNESSKSIGLVKLFDSIGTSYNTGNPTTEEVIQLFLEGCQSYTTTITEEEKKPVHSLIDHCGHCVSKSGEINILVNEVLVHTGLIKSEDKSFKPIPNIQGPLLGLVYLTKQDYFPAESKDILNAFFQRPNEVIDSIRHHLFSELFT